MNIPIEPSILNFIGYGNSNAKYWFIGLEEGFDKSRPPLEEQHKARLTYSQIMDLEEAMIKAEKWKNIKEKIDSLSTDTWSFMTKIIMNLENQPWYNFKDKNQRIKKFMVSNLGRRDGLTLLTEIFPLPKSSFDDWPIFYEKYYSDVETYRKEVVEYRIDLIGKLIKDKNPIYIFAYGKGKWDHYKSLFPDIKFEEHPNSNERRTYSIGRSGNTKVILTYFLGQGQFSDEDTFHLCSLIKIT